MAAIIAAAVGVGAVLLNRKSGPSGPSVSFPATWDNRVSLLVQFVEREHQASFAHPVYIDYVDSGEFARRAHDIDQGRTDAVQTLLTQHAGVLRSLGIAQGKPDLGAAAEAIDANRRALYSTTTQRIAVNGLPKAQLDENTQVQIVRALVLALDQQIYGLTTKFADDQAAWAYFALREGDAQRIADAYVAALDPAERTGIKDPYDTTVAGVTDVVRSLERAAPVLGEQFVDAIVAGGGNKALAGAFATPPVTEEQIMNPTAYPNDGPKTISAPKLESGETGGARGTLGSVGWLVMLGEHVAPDVTVRAVDGWANDAYVSYQFQNGACVRINWIGDNTQDVNEMSQAAAAWVSGMPAGNSQYTNQNNVITVVSCDPGATQPLTTGRSSDALAYVQFRATAFEAQLARKVTPAKAWCIATRVTDGATAADIAKPDVLSTPAYEAKITQYTADCS